MLLGYYNSFINECKEVFHVTFIDKVKQLIDRDGISANKLFADIGLSHNTMRNWIDKGQTPSSDTVAKIAKYFNISSDYLLGIETEKAAQGITLNDFEIGDYKLSAITEYSEEEKQEFLRLAKMFDDSVKLKKQEE